LQTDIGVSGRLHLRHGSRRDGVWGGTLTLPRWMRSRSATYTFMFRATDWPGNEQLVGADELAERDLPSSVVVTTRRPDRDDPRLTRVELAPAEVDLTNGDRPVTATVRAIDQSGIGDTYFFLRPMHRVRGDRHRGVWRRTESLDHCTWRTRDIRLEIILFDRAGNRVAVRQPLSITNHNDIRPPRPTLVGPDQHGPSDPVTYRFGEDVVGISDTSAPVRPTEGGAAFGTGSPPEAVPGHWSCASSAGTPVDCVSGPLRIATWSPLAPLTVDRSYLPDFNPEHVLDILDLAGNPLDIGLRFEDEFAPTWFVTD
jgi:hypothetical protein